MLRLEPPVLQPNLVRMAVSCALFSLMILAIALKLGLLVILVISDGLVIFVIAYELGRSGDLGCCSRSRKVW